MRYLWRALFAAILFVVEWLADRLYGDAIFAAVRPMIPPAVSDPALDYLLTWVPPTFLLGLVASFLYQGRREIRLAHAGQRVGISAKADAAQEPLSARQDDSKALDELDVKITGGVFWAIREAVGVVASAREIVTHKGPDELIEKLRKAKRAIEFVVAELMDAARRHHDVANEIFDDRVVGYMFLVKALQRMDRFIFAVEAMGPRPDEKLIYAIMEAYQEDMLDGLQICRTWADKVVAEIEHKQREHRLPHERAYVS